MSPQGRLYSNDALIERLRDAAATLGRMPTKRDLGNGDLPSYRTYYDRFGSWSAALRLAFDEAEVSARVRGLADDDVMRDDMAELARRLGRPPTVREMTRFGSYHASTYIRHYGSWSRAVRAILG